MRSKRLYQLKFIGLILILSFLGCNTNKKIFDYGKIENGKYHNTFFELEITLPPDWAIRTQEQLQNLTEKGKKMIAGDDKNMKAIVDAVDIENAVLSDLYPKAEKIALRLDIDGLLSFEEFEKDFFDTKEKQDNTSKKTCNYQYAKKFWYSQGRRIKI